MKPYQKAIVAIIVILALINYLPPVINFIKGNSRVKVGPVWQTSTKTLYFMNNTQTGEMFSMSYKKVIKVDTEKDSVYYYCSKSDDFSNCVEVYGDNIKGFTFSSEGWKTSLVSE